MLRPFFFGTEERPLLGICRMAGQPRNHGVVLCYPHAHEYIRCHRAFREIARRLVRAGYHVLTFDYYGCGDSGGKYEDGRISGWCHDISSAVDVIKKECHIDRVCLLGLRLGASLATMTAAERDDIHAMVLWDPVVRGKDLVEEMLCLPSTFPRGKNPPYRYDEDKFDVIGYPLTLEMIKDLERLDLLNLNCLSGNKVLIVETGEETDSGNLRKFSGEKDDSINFRHIPEASIWLKEPYEAIVPQKTLQSIVAWISEVCT
ncbi:MAG: alpha/beta fold hydrolase [bacterium]